MTASVEGRIHDAMQRLTAAEKRAGRALLSNYPTLGFAPVAEFADRSGASPATVLRFVSKLGFRSYPDFQRALREEFDERTRSPLQRGSEPAASGEEAFLDTFLDSLTANLRRTAAGIPESEFEAACQKLASPRQACHLLGGRFTDPIARYLLAHLQLVRPNVRGLSGRFALARDELLDVRAGDIAVLFDIRRYDDELLRLAEQLAARRAFTILVTDEWISPISRHAKIVLPCRIGVGRPWDSSAALFALAEAMIARVTLLAWPSASRRMVSSEET